jgi:hypothetical protein
VARRGYLYYVSVRPRSDAPGLYSWGILLATTTDGTHFTQYDADGDGHPDPVLVQSAAYPVAQGYAGYSTAFGLLDSNRTFHLFYDVARYFGADDWRQVALAHATSTDGIHFREIEADTFTIGGTSWHSWEISSPSVLEDGNILRMWFSGRTGTNDWTTEALGEATFGASCQ